MVPWQGTTHEKSGSWKAVANGRKKWWKDNTWRLSNFEPLPCQSHGPIRTACILDGFQQAVDGEWKMRKGHDTLVTLNCYLAAKSYTSTYSIHPCSRKGHDTWVTLNCQLAKVMNQYIQHTSLLVLKRQLMVDENDKRTWHLSYFEPLPCHSHGPVPTACILVGFQQAVDDMKNEKRTWHMSNFELLPCHKSWTNT